jgi:signal transduction histidine kinase
LAVIDRQARTGPSWLPSQTGLIEGVRWLIKLRWLAICGVIVALIIGIRILGLPLFWQGILAVALALVILNLIYWMILRERFEDRQGEDQALASATFFTHLQVILDLVLLTLLLYFAGGALNPFSFFYIFHIIISSILLKRTDSFLQAGWALILFLVLVFLTSSMRVPHFPLYHDFEPGDLLRWDQTLILISAFAITVFVAAFLSTSIMERLRQREQELASAYEEVIKRERIKGEFARTVAHELRSPMSAVMDFIYAIRITEKDRLSEKSQEYLERALQRGRGLIDLIRDLLELAWLESQSPPKTEEMDEVDLITEIELILALEKTSPDAKTATIKFNHPPSVPRIRYSKAAVQEIFSNLICNAFRYTPAGGEVCVDINQEDHRIKCQVSDTGIGIPRSAQDQIFSEFYRAPNARQFSPAGTGLGLSITKTLIARYGGEIRLESEEGKGTTFTVYFDLEPKKIQQIPTG